MKPYNGIKLLCTAAEIMDELGMSRKNGTLYRTYLPTKNNPKLKNRKKLIAFDIYTYLKKTIYLSKHWYCLSIRRLQHEKK